MTCCVCEIWFIYTPKYISHKVYHHLNKSILQAVLEIKARNPVICTDYWPTDHRRSWLKGMVTGAGLFFFLFSLSPLWSLFSNGTWGKGILPGPKPGWTFPEPHPLVAVCHNDLVQSEWAWVSERLGNSSQHTAQRQEAVRCVSRWALASACSRGESYHHLYNHQNKVIKYCTLIIQHFH